MGDRVRVQIEFDARYRNGAQHPMLQWFKQAIAGNPQAMKYRTALIPSRQKEILRYFSRLNWTIVVGILLKPSMSFRQNRADSWLARGRTRKVHRVKDRLRSLVLFDALPHEYHLVRRRTTAAQLVRLVWESNGVGCGD
jgi:hypothetical protein